MTGRPRLSLLYLPAVLLCTANFAASPEVAAKPQQERGTGNGRAWGRLRKIQANSAPTISGTPDATVLESQFYEFVPSASDPDSSSLTFTIANKPGWADFDPTTGALYGVPSSADVGRYSNIQIGVSDGLATAELPGFSIEVTATALGSVTLQWQPPSDNTDGSPLTDLARFRIYYGLDPSQLDNVVELSNPGLTSHVVENLSPNTWYFAMTALNSAGQESDFSGHVIGDTR